jgi:hypothetical protein
VGRMLPRRQVQLRFVLELTVITQNNCYYKILKLLQNYQLYRYQNWPWLFGLQWWLFLFYLGYLIWLMPETTRTVHIYGIKYATKYSFTPNNLKGILIISHPLQIFISLRKRWTCFKIVSSAARRSLTLGPFHTAKGMKGSSVGLCVKGAYDPIHTG